MAAMLSKFRIEYADVRIIPDISRPPSQATLDLFLKSLSIIAFPYSIFIKFLLALILMFEWQDALLSYIIAVT